MVLLPYLNLTYLTYTEWSTLYGGKRPGTTNSETEKFRRLPFDHCALSLQPFEDPYVDADGNIFDFEPLKLFLKKYKVNPVTGKKLDINSLVKLNFFKNAEDEYHCPVLFKVFTKNSHIVCVRTTGNVFSHEAVDQLNVKGKNWKDLVTDVPFTRADLVTLQDPNNLTKFNISTFHHVKKNLRVETEEEMQYRREGAAGRLRSVPMEAREALAELERGAAEAGASAGAAPAEERGAEGVVAAPYSTGAVGASFTSTGLTPVSVQRAAALDRDTLIYDRVHTKGYVRLVTSQGPLNLELYCDVTPRTCHNFIRLCTAGYYDNTLFHRSIRHYMIQGGDPTGTGLGGTSSWGAPFPDEIRPQLCHRGRGVLSMANQGPDTNQSQFFITFRSCGQLDGKHTVFGRVVGGMDTLAAMEAVGTDNRDRPVTDITLVLAQVFTDPFRDADDQLTAEIADEEKKRTSAGAGPAAGVVARGGVARVRREGAQVGKYLPLAADPPPPANAGPPPAKKKTTAVYKFGTFDSW